MSARRRGTGAAAPKPEPRTVSVTIDRGEFAGWTCVARADFPARVLSDMESGNLSRVLGALDSIVVSHNFPAEDGTVAATMADVDPYRGVMAAAGAIFDALGKLPPR